MRSLRPPRPAPRTIKKTHPSLYPEPKGTNRGHHGGKPRARRGRSGSPDSDTSSTFSLELGAGPEMVPHPPRLGGSRRDLRHGGIVLNASKLR
jgi:hypothetical protein